MSLKLWLLICMAAKVGYGTSPIVTCTPKSTDTFLCTKIANTSTIVNPSSFCKKNQQWYYDPSNNCDSKVRCVNMIPEGDNCKINWETDYPGELCDTGLTCVRDVGATTATCKKNRAMKCVLELETYLSYERNGSKGPALLHPTCNFQSQYAAKQCSPSSTCYCTDVDGNRLFGEEFYKNKDDMTCACAQHWKKNADNGLTRGLRCLSNGNFDPLQCPGDFCYCLDPNTMDIAEGPYPSNITTMLKCFDKDTDSKHYTNPCEKALEEFEAQNPTYENGIVLGGSKAPKCNPDGWYAPVQPHPHDGYWCVKPNGDAISNLDARDSGRNTEVFRFAHEYSSKCHCATRSAIMVANKLLRQELPLCCSDGSFKPRQSKGMWAYCVDQNGNQEGPAVTITEADSLPCYKQACPHKYDPPVPH